MFHFAYYCEHLQCNIIGVGIELIQRIQRQQMSKKILKDKEETKKQKAQHYSEYSKIHQALRYTGKWYIA